MEVNQVNCQNCEQPFDEGFKFCPTCGQKTNEELTMGVLFYNTISNYFSFDARFLKSFFPLLFKPGHLAIRFLEGKRLLYLHPAQMYLFVSVIFFFLFSFTVNDFIEEANKTNEKLSTSEGFSIMDDKQQQSFDSILKTAIEKPLMVNGDSINLPQNETQKLVDSISNSISNNTISSGMNLGINKKRLDSLRNAGLDENAIYKEMGMEDDANFLTKGLYRTLVSLADGKGFGLLIKRFVDAIPIAMFFLLPIFALILKIFYYRRGPYAYHLVFSFYFFSFLFTVFAILLGVNRFIVEIPTAINVLIALSTFIYFYIAMLNFYKRNWFFTFIKSGITTFVFLMVVLPFTFAILSAFAFVNA